MSILSLDEAKTYLKIDYNDEDDDIGALIDAAEMYLKNAGCVLNTGDELAKLAEKMLVVNWYENRELTGSATQLTYGLQCIISQLQNCYEGGTS